MKLILISNKTLNNEATYFDFDLNEIEEFCHIVNSPEKKNINFQLKVIPH